MPCIRQKPASCGDCAKNWAIRLDRGEDPTPSPLPQGERGSKNLRGSIAHPVSGKHRLYSAPFPQPDWLSLAHAIARRRNLHVGVLPHFVEALANLCSVIFLFLRRETRRQPVQRPAVVRP